MRYRIDEPNVISETMGDETIIVNLSSGHYFSLQGANVDVWNCLDRGCDASAVPSYLEQAYDVGDADVGASVAALVEQLQQEGLVVPRTDDVDPAELPDPPAGEERPPFAMPPLSKFTDMQDIILLDPVHEVDARGWPHNAPAAG